MHDSHWPEWMVDAICTQIGTDAFYPRKGQQWQTSRRICLEVCPVREQCTEYAMTIERGMLAWERHGVIGGMTPTERMKYEPMWIAGQNEVAA